MVGFLRQRQQEWANINTRPRLNKGFNRRPGR
jgi:hypothetical protein